MKNIVRELYRAQSFSNFRALNGLKFLISFLTRSGVHEETAKFCGTMNLLNGFITGQKQSSPPPSLSSGFKSAPPKSELKKVSSPKFQIGKKHLIPTFLFTLKNFHPPVFKNSLLPAKSPPHPALWSMFRKVFPETWYQSRWTYYTGCSEKTRLCLSAYPAINFYIVWQILPRKFILTFDVYVRQRNSPYLRLMVDEKVVRKVQ